MSTRAWRMRLAAAVQGHVHRAPRRAIAALTAAGEAHGQAQLPVGKGRGENRGSAPRKWHAVMENFSCTVVYLSKVLKRVRLDALAAAPIAVRAWGKGVLLMHRLTQGKGVVLRGARGSEGGKRREVKGQGAHSKTTCTNKEWSP